MSQDILGLTGKHAIVWGGGFGMGERTSFRLSEAGAHVAVVDLEQARAEKIAGEINAAGGKAIALQADATSALAAAIRAGSPPS